MTTGLAVPQPADSELLHDVRFGALRAAQDSDRPSSGEGTGKDEEHAAFVLLAQSTNPDYAAILLSAITVIGAQLAKQLRSTEAIDPERPLLQYGMDSLAAVELRNWVHTTLRVELATLDVVNAASLTRLCERMSDKMGSDRLTLRSEL